MTKNVTKNSSVQYLEQGFNPKPGIFCTRYPKRKRSNPKPVPDIFVEPKPVPEDFLSVTETRTQH